MTENQCSICLESLCKGGAIGVTTPCGHCFHRECYSGWAQFSIDKNIRNSGGDELRARCPNCNRFITDFVDIYISFDELQLDDNDDDDSSCASSTSNDPETGGSLSEEIRSSGETAINHSTDITRIDIDSNHKTRNDITLEQELKRTKRKYRLSKQKLSSFKELRITFMEMNKKHREMKDEFENLKSKEEKFQITLAEALLAARRHERQKTELEKELEKNSLELKESMQTNSDLSAKLLQSRIDLQQKLDDAHASSMSEVQEIRKQYQIMSRKNEDLMEVAKRSDLRLKYLEDEVERLQRFQNGTNTITNTTESHRKSGTISTKAKVKLILEANEQIEKQTAKIEADERIRRKKIQEREMMKKISSHASRISQAAIQIHKQKARVASSLAADSIKNDNFLAVLSKKTTKKRTFNFAQLDSRVATDPLVRKRSSSSSSNSLGVTASTNMSRRPAPTPRSTGLLNTQGIPKLRSNDIRSMFGRK